LSYLTRLFGKRKKGFDFSLYSVRKSLLTENEKKFYRVLKMVVGERLEVFSKVRLSDVFWINRGSGYQGALNRINPRHLDFLLCEKINLRPVLGIELDDASHSRSDRAARDDFVNELFEETGLPLLRVQSKGDYCAEELRDMIVREARRKRAGGSVLVKRA
jgi:hypothetical protein